MLRRVFHINQDVRISFDKEDNEINEGFKPEWHHIFPRTLTIESRNGAHFVHAMYLADLGLELRYRVPSIPKNERQLAQGPASIEHVLIATGK